MAWTFSTSESEKHDVFSKLVSALIIREWIGGNVSLTICIIPFQFVAVVFSLACVVSAQLTDNWSNNPRADVDSDDLAVKMGRNILFRGTSTRFEKLEQTTETLAKNLQGTQLRLTLTNAKIQVTLVMIFRDYSGVE